MVYAVAEPLLPRPSRALKIRPKSLLALAS
jgi:hypothetical protein